MVKTWELFVGEYKTWYPDSDGDDHLLDALASYLLHCKPWSRRMPKIVGSRR